MLMSACGYVMKSTCVLGHISYVNFQIVTTYMYVFNASDYVTQRNPILGETEYSIGTYPNT